MFQTSIIITKNWFYPGLKHVQSQQEQS